MLDDELDRSMSLLLSTLTRTTRSEDVYKITQSVLCLAHVKSVLMEVSQGIPRERKVKAAS